MWIKKEGGEERIFQVFFEGASKRGRTRFTLFIRKYAIHSLCFCDFDSDTPDVEFLAILCQNGFSAGGSSFSPVNFSTSKSNCKKIVIFKVIFQCIFAISFAHIYFRDLLHLSTYYLSLFTVIFQLL